MAPFVALVVLTGAPFVIDPIDTSKSPPRLPRKAWILERIRNPPFRMDWRINPLRKDAPSNRPGQR